MHYAQLKEDGSFDRELPDGNVEFSPRCFQPARTLDAAERALFRVVPLLAVAAPSFDPITQKIERAGAELVGVEWRQKWAVIALDAATIAANQAAAAEAARLAEIKQAVRTDAVLTAIASMSKVQYDTFWTNRTAAQKDKILQLLLLAYANQA